MTNAEDKPFAKKADEAAKYISIRFKSPLSWPAMRDVCDALTGSELECFELDMLTDMTQARLNKQNKAA